MKKILFMLVIFISTSVYAQKDQLIGSWVKAGPYDSRYIVTFFQNGSYNIDNLIDDGPFTYHWGFPSGLKWKVDKDSTLCVYGQWIVSTAFVRVSLNENSKTSFLSEEYMRKTRIERERIYKEKFRKDLINQGKLKPDYYYFFFDSKGQLKLKLDTSVEWETYEKTNLPWRPSAKKSKNTRKR